MGAGNERQYRTGLDAVRDGDRNGQRRIAPRGHLDRPGCRLSARRFGRADDEGGILVGRDWSPRYEGKQETSEQISSHDDCLTFIA